MNWKFWQHKRTVQVISREITKLKLHEWQSNETLVKGARVALSGDYVRLMLEVLRNEHPGFIVAHPESRLDTRAVYQARAEGYTMAIANLEAMGTFVKPQQILEPSFEPEQESA